MRKGIEILLRWAGNALIAVILLVGYRAFADGNLQTDDAPKYVPYKGTLERDGVAYQGTIPMRFDLYDADAPSTVAWTETQAVTVYGGRFSVLLGSTSTASVENLSSVLTKGDDISLSITLDPSGDNVQLANRQRFLPVPMAMWTTSSTDFSVGGSLTVDTTLDVAADGETAPVIVRDPTTTMALGVDRLNTTGDLYLNEESGGTVHAGGALDVGTTLATGGAATIGGPLVVNGQYLDLHSQSSGVGGRAMGHASGNILKLNPLVAFASTNVAGKFIAQGDTKLGNSSTNSHTINGTAQFNNRAKFLGTTTIGDAATDTLGVTATATFNNNVTLGSSTGDSLQVKATSAFQGKATFNGGIDGASATYTIDTNGCYNVSVTDISNSHSESRVCGTRGILIGGIFHNKGGDSTSTAHVESLRCCKLKITVN